MSGTNFVSVPYVVPNYVEKSDLISPRNLMHHHFSIEKKTVYLEFYTKSDCGIKDFFQSLRKMRLRFVYFPIMIFLPAPIFCPA